MRDLLPSRADFSANDQDSVQGVLKWSEQITVEFFTNKPSFGAWPGYSTVFSAMCLGNLKKRQRVTNRLDHKKVFDHPKAAYSFPLLQEEAEGLFWLVLGSSICFSEDNKGRCLYDNFTKTTASDTSQPQSRSHVCGVTIPIWRWELWNGLLIWI